MTAAVRSVTVAGRRMYENSTVTGITPTVIAIENDARWIGFETTGPSLPVRTSNAVTATAIPTAGTPTWRRNLESSERSTCR